MLRSCFLVAAPLASAYAFRVCGNYCGPGWCNAVWLEEAQCNDTAPSEEDSCADACCKVHDTCCGHLTPTTGKQHCNHNIVDCLKECETRSSSNCTDALGVHVPPNLIATGMEVVEDWCCGAPCPKSAATDALADATADAPANSTVEDAAASTASARRALVGGWRDRENLSTASHGYRLAAFALEGLRGAGDGAPLRAALLVRLTAWRTQLVSGTNHALTAETSAGELTLQIYEQAWTDTLRVTSAALRTRDGGAVAATALLPEGGVALDAKAFSALEAEA